MPELFNGHRFPYFRRVYYGSISVLSAVCLIVASLIFPGPTLPTMALATALQAQVPSPTATAPPVVETPPPARVPEGNKVDGFPVLLDGEPLFYVRVGLKDVATPEERADVITQRITQVAHDSAIAPDDIRVITEGKQSIVMAGEIVLFTVNEQDADFYGEPHPVLADKAAQYIRQAIITFREERSLRRQVISILTTVVSTIVVFLFLRGVFFVTSKLLTRIRAGHQAGTLALRLQNMQILGSYATSYLLSVLLRLTRLILILTALYLYVPFVLSQFPATKRIGARLLEDIAYRVSLLTQAFVGYLPSLTMLLIIGLITYYIIGFAKQVIFELGRPGIYPWFYAEWVNPTIRLTTFLIIAIALVVAGPYLPGFGSPAFQGVSLFLGALLTLGSSSAISNAIAGLILIYTRAFQIGDFIRIGETMGTVEDKSLFVMRMITPKKETTTIPNSVVLNSNVVNYSAICREADSALVLHTTITLGYDLSWRQVHDVLINAAKHTSYIEASPEPFVLQTSLNDFHISYELNAYTKKPELMPRIYSELHQNIQDYCNQAGIEILSPGFSALRDGNHSTIPADYLPPDYQAPGFTVQPPPPHSKPA